MVDKMLTHCPVYTPTRSEWLDVSMWGNRTVACEGGDL
jgi:hypothetical protein